MEVRYQRDLYRVQLCCDTEKNEEALGYPLQMCLRNTIDGLLACQVQGTDDRLTICWDVTSRHTLAQVTGEGQIAPVVLQRILQALLQTMEAMARYLLPCEYLVLDPKLLFLLPESGDVGFVCNFENPQSFQKTLLMLGEYVLEHMDHREQTAMHLGYGLYRLAVEDCFDKEGLRRLCTQMPLPGSKSTENTVQDDAWQKEITAHKSALPEGWQSRTKENMSGRGDYAANGKKILREQEREVAMQRRADVLESFFAEDEEEARLQVSPWQVCGGCAVAILAGTGIMEGVQYFRNGRHLQPIWWMVAVVLFLLSVTAMLLLWKLSGKKEKKMKVADNSAKCFTKRPESLQKNAKQSASTGGDGYEKKAAEAYGGYRRTEENRYGEMSRMSAAYRMTGQEIPESMGDNRSQSMETVVLNRSMPETTGAQLSFADGRTVPLRGRQWLIGKSPTDTDICLPQPTVSRIHARIWKKEEAYYIEDLHSRNGTMVGGQLLEPGEKRQLEPGVELAFAEQMCTFIAQQGFHATEYSCNAQYNRR